MRMKQREILSAIAPDFARDNETQEQYIDKKIAYIRQAIKDYILSTGMNGFILGLSGGIDSYAAGALTALALSDIGKTLRLVLLPNGKQPDIDDSVECASALSGQFENIEVETISIEHGFKGVLADISKSWLYDEDDRMARGNIQPRLRMVVQYALARGLLVCGTDHATENVTGYFTKYGDGGTDFNPLDCLVKDDIYDIAKRFRAPECVLLKKPAAGLGISASDEEELGMTYADICRYLKCSQIEKTKAERLARLYDRAIHKRNMPASPENDWWRPHEAEPTHIVMNMLNDYIEGPLACEGAQEAAESCRAYIDAHPAQRVLYVRDCHLLSHHSFESNGGEWPPHCVQGTWGDRLYPAFYEIKKTVNSPVERYNVFSKGMEDNKDEISGFGAANEFYGALKFNLTHRVILSGIATEYIVRQTALDLLDGGFEVALLRDGVAGIDANDSAEVLAELAALGVKLI